MGCNKKHNYSKIMMGDNDYNDMSMKGLAKQGNKSISGLIGKCVAVKKKGCRKWEENIKTSKS